MKIRFLSWLLLCTSVQLIQPSEAENLEQQIRQKMHSFDQVLQKLEEVVSQENEEIAFALQRDLGGLRKQLEKLTNPTIHSELEAALKTRLERVQKVLPKKQKIKKSFCARRIF